MTLFAHGGISKKLCGVYVYDKWNFKPKISSTFHFELVNDGWISHILYVNPGALHCRYHWMKLNTKKKTFILLDKIYKKEGSCYHFLLKVQINKKKGAADCWKA